MYTAEDLARWADERKYKYQDGYYLVTGCESEFPFAVWSRDRGNDKLILVPRSLTFEAEKDNHKNLKGMMIGAMVRVILDENDHVIGFRPLGKFNIGDMKGKDTLGIEPDVGDHRLVSSVWWRCCLIDGNCPLFFQLKDICAFSKDATPVCATRRFGILPLVKGLDARDFEPWVFFHCLVRYDIKMTEPEEGNSQLPKAKISFYVYEIIEPVIDPNRFGELEQFMRREVGAFCYRWVLG